MKNILFIIIIFTLSAYSIDDFFKPNIQKFIEMIKNDERYKLAENINYPLKRKFPVPNIRNSFEFLARYDEIFDSTTLEMIINSNLEHNWKEEFPFKSKFSKSGHEVILDAEGRLKYISSNTELELKIKTNFLDSLKSIIYHELNNIEDIVLEASTRKHYILLYHLSGFNIAIWNKNISISEKPEYIFYNGITLSNDGNDSHLFWSLDKKNKCDINLENGFKVSHIGKNLRIYINNKKIIDENLFYSSTD